VMRAGDQECMSFCKREAVEEGDGGGGGVDYVG